MSKTQDLKDNLAETEAIVRRLKAENEALKAMLHETLQNKALLELQLRTRLCVLSAKVEGGAS